jgi:hypothetical protein
MLSRIEKRSTAVAVNERRQILGWAHEAPERVISCRVGGHRARKPVPAAAAIAGLETRCFSPKAETIYK